MPSGREPAVHPVDGGQPSAATEFNVTFRMWAHTIAGAVLAIALIAAVAALPLPTLAVGGLTTGLPERSDNTFEATFGGGASATIASGQPCTVAAPGVSGVTCTVARFESVTADADALDWRASVSQASDSGRMVRAFLRLTVAGSLPPAALPPGAVVRVVGRRTLAAHFVGHGAW